MQTSPKTDKANRGANKRITRTKRKTDTKTPTNTERREYGNVKQVTAAKLKRTFVNDGVRGSFFISEDTFRWLTLLGIQMGVTWDEVLRGMIEIHRQSADPQKALEYFIPALNS